MPVLVYLDHHAPDQSSVHADRVSLFWQDQESSQSGLLDLGPRPVHLRCTYIGALYHTASPSLRFIQRTHVRRAAQWREWECICGRTPQHVQNKSSPVQVMRASPSASRSNHDQL